MISIISKLVNAYIIITIILNVCDGLKKLKVKLNPLNANISMAWGGGGHRTLGPICEAGPCFLENGSNHLLLINYGGLIDLQPDAYRALRTFFLPQLTEKSIVQEHNELPQVICGAELTYMSQLCIISLSHTHK